MLALLLLTCGLGVGAPGVPATPTAAGPVRACIPLEFFVRPDSKHCENERKFLDNLVKRHPEVRIIVRDVIANRADLVRFHELAKKFQIKEPGVPSVLVCNKFIVGYADEKTTGKLIEAPLTMEVFTRQGCPHCDGAKLFVADLQRRYPGLPVKIHDVVNDSASLQRMDALTREHNVQVPSLPFWMVFGQPVVGYQDANSTGREVERFVTAAVKLLPPEPPAAKPAPKPPVAAPAAPAASAPSTPAPAVPAETPPKTSLRSHRIFNRSPLASAWRPAALGLTLWLAPPAAAATDPVPVVDAVPAIDSVPGLDSVPAPPSGPGGKMLKAEGSNAAPVDAVPLPPEISSEEVSAGSSTDTTPERKPSEIDVPYLGRLDMLKMGLPVFTILIGLVDGFNPCAMWVLVFLLSVLAGLKDRWRMVAIAGTFVLVSGLVYFAFMAGLLRILTIFSYIPALQTCLGILAIIIGLVNIKDFLWFGKGFSFSIPDSAKPGIYSRMRQIMAAKNLFAAICGAIVLALLINTIELACTAGLPTAYINILNMQKLPAWNNYMYLGLYNLAYMFDDSIMLGIAVVTMSNRRLQQAEGRWLKLLSGLVILTLGLLLVFKPSWLAWS